jgi:hypothetical protein
MSRLVLSLNGLGVGREEEAAKSTARVSASGRARRVRLTVLFVGYSRRLKQTQHDPPQERGIGRGGCEKDAGLSIPKSTKR